MTKVSYFQRFSQKENHLTNNTLLVLRFIYQKSPFKLEAVLSELVGENIDIGPNFEQQIRESSSTPDAVISQRPLQLFIETKLHGQLDREQIIRHINSITECQYPPSRKIIIGLTKIQISEIERRELVDIAAAKSIIFVAITFTDIVQALRSCCEVHELELKDILEDYEEYLNSEEVLQVGELMSVVPCGNSLEENKQFRLYFEPAHRSSKFKSTFMGLYKQKCIQEIGRIGSIVVGRMVGDKFDFEVEGPQSPSDDDIDRIEKAIEACSKYPELKTNLNRYYLFNELEETSIMKTSRGGLRSHRVINLAKWLDYSDPSTKYDTAVAARSLSGKCFG